MILVDDLLLLYVLAGQVHPAVAPYGAAAASGGVFTTGTWYWRLARGVTHPSSGVFSGYLASLPEDQRFRMRAAVDKLPDGIGVLNLKRLVPVMAALPGQLNLLTAEAVAAAVVLDATIAVTTESDLLIRAAGTAGVLIEVVSLER